MAKAGYCSKCGTNMWLDASGRCAAGHGPECVSGAYDVAVVSSPKQSSNLIWLIALPFVAMVLVLILGILVAIAIPVFSTAKTNAQKRSCLANMRVVEGAAAVYRADHDGEKTADDWNGLMAQISPSYIGTTPVCIVGGTYTWMPSPDPAATGNARCSVHGSIPTPSSFPPGR